MDAIRFMGDTSVSGISGAGGGTRTRTPYGNGT